MKDAGSYAHAGMGKAKKSRGKSRGPCEELLYEMGLGREHWKRTTGVVCCVSLFLETGKLRD